nr:divergent polysaccharide deacetylase family protein [Sneathiella chinensis]
MTVFCGAVLVVSLAGGMLIGGVVKNNGSADGKVADGTPLAAAVPPTTPAQPEKGYQPYRPADRELYSPEPEKPAPEPDLASTQKGQEKVASLPPAVKTPPATGLEGGLPTWRRYAAAAVPANGQPRIAIVIDDVGLNRQRVRDLAALPEVVTMAFLPYANHLEDSVALIRSEGHEAMLHLPMEPSNASVDPGPDALLDRLSPAEIRERTVRNLDRFGSYVGVNNHMGSKFTANEDNMRVVMDILAERGMLFLDSRTTPNSAGARLAAARGMPTGVRDVFIDNVIEVPAILSQLEEAERLARRNGLSIAIGHPHKATIEALREWLPKAAANGFVLVPISAALAPEGKGARG